ncbi:MAG: class I SAM-dependent methyltransferase [Gemmatimonadota bacterium]|nr:MAG: class I SAM-dependent methyltransferase [Gemmatimonadota bacterium]
MRTPQSVRPRVRSATLILRAALACGTLFLVPICSAQETRQQQDLDNRVRQFLGRSRYRWRDMNVSESDGRVLYDLVVQNNYTRALEIGTSTGHSAIWIAWALSKTGGKLVTIEISERRHNQALENFAEAGLSEFIDARLADAHDLVPRLEGPFDFIFVDADKDWYARYFQLLLPKLEVGGCFTAHNVSGRRIWGIREFLEALENTPNLETEIVRSSRAGISVSCKKSPS